MVSFIPSPFSSGIQQLGSSLGKGLEQRFATEREKKQKDLERQRQARSGTVLGQVLGELPENASVQQFQSTLAKAIEQGVDPTIVNQFAQQYAPFLKEQARSQGIASFLQNLGLQSPQRTSEEDGTPEIGFAYDQIDNVPNGIDQTQIDTMIASPYPEIQSLGKAYDDRRRESRKNWEADRNFHAKGLAKTEEKIGGLRDKVEKRKNVLNLSRGAIESGEVGRFSRNAIANSIGGPIGDLLRTKTGADFGLAAKENLVSGLSQISARAANMFMEKRLLDAFAKVGQSEAANLSVQNFLETENALDDAYIRAYDKLAEQDMKNFGFERKDLDKRAREAAKDEQQKIFNLSSVRNREYIEKEKGPNWMNEQITKKVDTGTPLTPAMYRVFLANIKDPEKALVRAKQLGYSVYPPSMLAGEK